MTEHEDKNLVQWVFVITRIWVNYEDALEKILVLILFRIRSGYTSSRTAVVVNNLLVTVNLASVDWTDELSRIWKKKNWKKIE